MNAISFNDRNFQTNREASLY